MGAPDALSSHWRVKVTRGTRAGSPGDASATARYEGDQGFARRFYLRHEGQEFLCAAVRGNAEVIAKIEMGDHIVDGPGLETGNGGPVRRLEIAQKAVQLVAFGTEIGNDILKVIHGQP